MALARGRRGRAHRGEEAPPRPIAREDHGEHDAGVGSNEKTISDQLAKFTIENCTNPSSSEAGAHAPPHRASTTASSRKDTRMLPRENPSARSVPISRCRLAIEAYIVIIAPIMAPMEKKTRDERAQALTNSVVPSDCFS